MATDDIKMAEFNSNLATLQRIDNLMRTLHELRVSHINDLYTSDDSYLRSQYYKTLKRLYLEGHKKFKADELSICEAVLQEVKAFMKLHSRDLENFSFKTSSYNVTLNRNYRMYWEILIEKLEAFEVQLVGYLDMHGMLLADKDNRLAASKV